jgi:hypothetical protein
MRKEVAYIAGPYRATTPHGIVQNIHRAEQYAKKYWRLGYVVICPHKNSGLLDGVLPDESWLEGAKELLRRSDLLVIMPEYQESNGTLLEIKLAQELNMQIIYEGHFNEYI